MALAACGAGTGALGVRGTGTGALGARGTGLRAIRATLGPQRTDTNPHPVPAMLSGTAATASTGSRQRCLPSAGSTSLCQK